MKTIKGVAAVLVMALLGGCAGTVKHMQPSTLEKTAVVKPDPGKATVVFMRPSGLGYAVQSSVFEVKNTGKNELVGIVAAKAKVAYQVEPGTHLFMSIGESAEFMTADVLAGKTYYARVAPRMGMWKARFALEPVNASALDSAEFKGDFADCTWVEKNAASEAWASENMPSIESKRLEYYPKWQSESAEKKAALVQGDGR